MIGLSGDCDQIPKKDTLYLSESNNQVSITVIIRRMVKPIGPSVGLCVFVSKFVYVIP